MIKNDNINLLVQKYRENKFSHIFLVETNNKEEALNDILELIKVINCPEIFDSSCNKCNLCHLIDIQSLPSLKIIYPDGQAIKKYQMEELKKEFSSLPYFSRFNTYIINNAEKFNESSANTMLKFIEEPEKNILGFLITNNKENVINTIKSRCEIVKAYYIQEQVVLNQRINDLAITYLYKLEVEKQLGIVYNKIIINEKLEKEELVLLFKTILNIYLNIFENKDIDEKLNRIKKLDVQSILKRIKLVSKMIERLNYNVNVNLLLDDFVLELED